MPVIYFKGGAGDEQSVGPQLDSGLMTMYAVRRDQPLNLISLGGHRVDEAPSYNITERKIAPEYRRENGRNTLVERTLTGDKVKSLSLNLKLPNKLLSVSDRIYQLQEKYDYDFFMFPENCETECDTFFYMGEELILGARQFDSPMVGWDDNEGVITSMRTANVAGQLRTYYGQRLKRLATQAADEALFAVEIGADDCTTSDCSNQNLYRGGDATIVEYSTDGGNSFTAYTTTAISTDLTDAVITDLKYYNGYLVVAYATAAQGVATDGGIAYIAPGSTTATLATGVTASRGIHKIVAAFNKLYAVGGISGTAYFGYSCDNGQTWTAITNSIGASLYSAAFDEDTNLLYLVGDSGEAWIYDGSVLTEISTNVNAGSVDLVTVVASGGHVIIGGADGKTRECYTADDFAAGYTAYTLSSNPIYAVAKDKYTYRTVLGNDTKLYLRDIYNKQLYTLQRTLGATVNKLIAAPELKDEGTNTFFFVLDNGEMWEYSYCFNCLGGGC